MELIDRNYILSDELTHTLPSTIGKASGRIVVFADDIENAPTVDAVPFNDYMEILNERNAAISALAGKCEYCRYVLRDKDFDACYICCLSTAHKYWEWRGVQDDTK